MPNTCTSPSGSVQVPGVLGTGAERAVQQGRQVEREAGCAGGAGAGGAGQRAWARHSSGVEEARKEAGRLGEQPRPTARQQGRRSSRLCSPVFGARRGDLSGRDGAPQARRPCHRGQNRGEHRKGGGSSSEAAALLLLRLGVRFLCAQGPRREAKAVSSPNCRLPAAMSRLRLGPGPFSAPPWVRARQLVRSENLVSICCGTKKLGECNLRNRLTKEKPIVR